MCSGGTQVYKWQGCGNEAKLLDLKSPIKHYPDPKKKNPTAQNLTPQKVPFK